MKQAYFTLRMMVATAFMAFVVSGNAMSAPLGGVVATGQATITTEPNRVQINQTTDKAVINWQKFDIKPNEHTDFKQPSTDSITLNRVHSNTASNIDGKLTANGNVVIVNQNGVMFGKNAKIDVNGLIATTADIDDEAFVNTQKLDFNKASTNPDAKIINNGTITAKQAGLVGLVAPNVENNGVITAKLGKVTLASGDTATVDLYGDGLLNIAVSDTVTKQLITNKGIIAADGGEIKLTAAAGKKIVDSLIENTGVLSANSVGVKNGVITISAEGSNAVTDNIQADKGKKQGTSTVLNSGTITATGYNSGEKGGTITIAGDNIGLLNGTKIDASGHTGTITASTDKTAPKATSAGGSIKIGGDYLGKGKTPTAKNLFVAKSTTIKNNATHTGDAGRTILWSDNRTEFHGDISAKALGQDNKGQGGFVETSGKYTLNATGTVQAGLWLLDPNNITIQTSGSNTNVNASPNFTTTNDSAIVTTGSIETALNAGTSVLIKTTSSGTNAQSGHITVSNAISKTSGGDATLTLEADNSIFVYANITSTSNKLHVVLNSDKDNSNAGQITVTGATITSNGGNITLGGGVDPTTDSAVGTTSNPQGILLTTSNLSAGIGDISIRGTGFSSASSSAGGIRLIGGSQITTTGSGNITLHGTGGNSGNFAHGVILRNGELISSVNGHINITGIGGGSTGESYGVALSDGSDILSTGSGNITLLGLRGTGSIGFFVGNNISTIIGGASATGNITLNFNDYSGTPSTSFQTSGSVTFAPYTLSNTIGVADGAGTTQLTSTLLSYVHSNVSKIIIGRSDGTGNIEVGTRGWGGDSLDILSNTGTITVSGTQTDINALTINNNAASSISTVLDTTIASLTKSGTGTLTLSGANTYTGATTINAGTLLFSGSGTTPNTNMITVNSGGILGFGRSDTWGNAATTSSAAIIVNAGGTVQSNGYFNTLWNLTLNGGTLDANGGVNSIYGSFGLAGTVTATGNAQIITSGANSQINLGNHGNLATTFLIASSGDSLTIAAVLKDHANGLGGGGATALTKSGTGTLTLSGANTYTGTTTVSAGTLTAGNASAFGVNSAVTVTGILDLAGFNVSVGSLAGAGTVTNSVATSNTLTSGGDNTSTTFSGIIQNGSGTTGLTKVGTGTLTLSGANTYTGATTVSAGTLQIGNGGTTGSINNTASITNNANLVYSFGTTTSVGTPQNYSGTGNLSLTAGMVWFPANITVGGNLTINSTTNSNAWISIQTNINPIITVGGTTSITGYLTGRNPGGTNTLTFNASGDVTLNNVVNGMGGNFWQWGTLNINAGTNAINVTGTSSMSQGSASSTWNLTGAVNVTGNIAAGTTGVASLNIAGTPNSTISGVLSGTIALTKSGTGTLILSGANTYTGTTTISSGTVIANVNTTQRGISTSAVSIASGATLQMNNLNTSGSTVTIANTFTGAGTLGIDFATGGAIRGTTVNGLAGFTGGVVLSTASTTGDKFSLQSNVGGSVTIGNGTTLFTAANLTITNGISVTGSGNTENGGALRVDNGWTLTSNVTMTGNSSFGAVSGGNGIINGVISGAFSLTKVGNATLTLSGANTYTGATTVSAGTLTAGNASAFGSNSATTVTGTLDLAGFNVSVGSLAGAGTVTNSVATSNTLTAGNDNTSTTFSGIIQNGTGTTGLTKVGTGTLTLSGANTYTGATTINGGTLQIGNGGTTGSISSSSAVSNSGTLALNWSSPTTFANAISGAGTISNIGTGLVTLSTTSVGTTGHTIDGGLAGITISGNLLNYSSGNAILHGMITLSGTNGVSNVYRSTQSGSSWTFASNASTWWIGAITPVNAPNITVNSGITISENASQAAGNLYYNNLSGAGTLQLTGAGLNATHYLLGNSSIANLSVAGNVFYVGNGGSTGAIVSGNISSAVGTILNTTTDYTFSGVLSGAGYLQKQASNIVTLSGANTYTGTTTVSAGTLTAGNASAFGVNSAVTVTGILDLAGFNVSVGSLAGAGTVTNSVATSNTLTSGGDNTSTTFSGIIQNGSGTTGLTKIGTGTLTLTGANTYTGATTVSAGTLQIGNGGTTGSINNTASITNNANLVYSFGTTTSVGTPQNYSGTGNLSLTAGAVWFPANITVGGNLTINSTTNQNWGALQTNINPIVTVGGTTSITGYLEGVAGGTNTLTLNASGDVTLNNIVNGVNGNIWNWGTFTINAGTNAINVTGTSSISLTTINATWNLTGAVNVTGNIAAGTTGVASLNIAGTPNSTISGVLSGTIALTKSGSGTLTLSGANTYTGNTTVSSGTVIANVNTTQSGISTSAVSIASGATLQMNNINILGSNVTIANTFTGAGTLGIDFATNSTPRNTIINGLAGFTGGFILSTASTTRDKLNLQSSVGGSVTIGNGTTLFFGSNNATITNGITITGSGSTEGLGALRVDNGSILTSNITMLGNSSFGGHSGTGTINGVISGAFSLTKVGNATLTLTGANTYTGSTTVSAGTLTAGNASAFGVNSAVTVTGILDIAGYNVSIGSLAGAGTVTNSVATSNTLTSGGDNTSTTFSGIIQNGSGTTGLTKVGTGTLTLSGANTYTGATTVSAGTLTLGASNVLSDSTDVSVTAGTFNFNNFTDTVASFTSSSGSVTSFGTGSLTTSGAQSFGGQVTGSTVSLTGSSITANNVLNDFTSTLTLSSTGAISIFDANALTIGTVSAGGNINFDAVTDITLNGIISKSSGSDATLTLEADNSIFVNANITSTNNKLHIVLNADKDNSNAGQITVDTATITSNNGNITLGGGVDPTTDWAMGTDSTNKNGVYLNGGSLIAGAGNIVIRGTGWSNAGINDLYGVNVNNGSVVQTTTGDITLHGRGGNGISANLGVRAWGASTLITSVDGDISITGIGASGASNIYNYGVSLFVGADITSTGTGSGAGNITIHGTGGSGTNFNHGVIIESTGTFITAVDGDITVTGIGATGASGNNNNGIGVTNGNNITTTGDGNITLSGIKGAGTSYGFLTSSTGTVIGGASATGNIVLNFDNYSLTASPSFNTEGSVTFAPYTASNSVGVADGAGTVQLTSTILGYVNSRVSKVIIGRSDGTGNIEVGTRGWGNDSLDILSNTGTITVSDNQTNINNLFVNTNNNIILNATLTATGNITLVTGGDLTNNAGSGALSAGGRWLVYNGDTNNASQTTGGLTGFNRYGCSYNAGSPSCGVGTDIPVSGNGFYYAFSPTVTITGLNGNKIYDATTTATLTGGSISGAVNGDSLTFGGTYTASFDNKNVGTNKTVTISASNYALTGTNMGYTLSQPTSLTANITPKALSITGLTGVNRVYDATTIATLSGTASLLGIEGSDSVTLNGSYSATFYDKNVGNNKTITVTGYSISDSNYTLSPLTGLTANITPKSLSITGLTGVNRVYDATTVATLSGTAALSGLEGSDSVTLNGSYSATFYDKNVGNNKTITVTGYSISDSNYSLSPLTGLTANITPKALSITGLTGVNRVYDATTIATLSGTASLLGIEGSDSVTLNGSYSATFYDKNVGNNKAITVSGYSISDSNYSLSPLTGLTANITPKALSITGFTGVNRVYDATTVATLSGTASLSGIEGSDSVTLNGSYSATFDDKNVGNNKTITVTGYSISDSNYTLSPLTGLTANITPKSLSITGLTGVNRVYDATTVATLSGTAALSGLEGSDSVTLNGSYSATFYDKNVGNNKTITVTGYSISDSNYSLSPLTGLTANITPKALSITGLTGVNRVYDATTIATLSGTASLLGIEGSDSVTLNGSYSATFYDKNVGNNKAITVSGYSISDSNYSLSPLTGLTANITPKALSITGLTGVNRVYDATTVATLSGTAALSGLEGSDSVTLNGSYSATFYDKNVGNNKAITVSGYSISDSNYSLSPLTGLTANITAKALSITGLTGVNRVYDATTVATLSGTASLSGIEGSDSVTLNGTYSANFDDKNVGNNKTITVTGYSISDSNYSLSPLTGLTANITPKALSITGLTGVNRVYDATTVATLSGTAALSGLEGSDSVTLNGSYSATFYDKNVGNNKAITVSGYSISDSNYSLSPLTGLTANITAKALSITGLTGVNRVYDATTVATLSGTAALSGLEGSDSVTLNGSYSATFYDKNVGNNKAITVSGYSISDSNYSLSPLTGLTANITPKALSITGLTGVNRVYDATTVATLSGTAALSGLEGSDSVTLNGSYSATFYDKNVGNNKTITVTGYSISDSNYSLSPLTGLTANITPKALSITGFTGVNRVYDATTVATLSGTASLSGIEGSDSVTLNGSYSATFDDKNVGNNKTITVTGYSISDSNYSLSPLTGLTANITPKALSITGFTGVNRVYDATTVATLSGTASLSGIEGSDSVTLNGTYSANFDDKNVGNNKTITVTGYSISDSNYSLSPLTGLTANITPKALSITGLTGVNRVYDATTVATLSGTAALSGLEGSDSVTLNGSYSATFYDKNVGNNKAITVSGYSISDSNYSLSPLTGLTANITAKALSITGLTGVNRVYDATTVATLSGTAALSGLEGSDSVTLNGSYSANFLNKNVGNNKAITVTGYNINNSNYSLTQPMGLTANITAKALTISGITADNKIYDATTTATLSGTGSLVGVLGSDTVTLGGTYVADFDNANVGTGKAITVSGYTINNSNYSLTQPTGLTANITAKALSITGITANNKIYDATTTATLSGTGSLVGVVGGDSVTLGGTYVADFDNANVGTGKAITVTGYNINNSNYSLTQPTGLTANIERKPISDTVLSVSQLPTQKIGLYDTFFLYKEALQSADKRINDVNYGYFLEQKNKTANKASKL